MKLKAENLKLYTSKRWPMPTFEDALTEIRYPSVKEVPFVILLRIFAIAQVHKILPDRSIEELVKAINTTSARIHGVMSKKATAEEILERLSRQD